MEQRVLHLQVAGVTHCNHDGSKRQEIIGRCDIGERLLLVPEPNNLTDPNAMKVCRANGQQVGYIASSDRLRMPKQSRVYVDRISRPDCKPCALGIRLRIEVDPEIH